ncbi:MAG: DUF4238 domain-containing protein [Clostridiaceae bacterium]
MSNKYEFGEEMDKKNEPIRQHTVPKVYLRKFSDKEFLWVYLKELNEYKYLNINYTSVHKDFYTIDFENEKDYRIENFFGENIETLYNTLIDKIVNYNFVTNMDKYALALYVSFQYLRTQRIRKIHDKIVSQMNIQTIDICDDILRVQKRDTHDSKYYHEKFHSYAFNETLPKEASLNFMLRNAKDLTDNIKNKDFFFFEAPNELQFVTSDNPCILVQSGMRSIYGRGFGNSEILFPLTCNISLYITGSNNLILHEKIGRDGVREINKATTYEAEKYIYAKDKYFLESLIGK